MSFRDLQTTVDAPTRTMPCTRMVDTAYDLVTRLADRGIRCTTGFHSSHKPAPACRSQPPHAPSSKASESVASSHRSLKRRIRHSRARKLVPARIRHAWRKYHAWLQAVTYGVVRAASVDLVQCRSAHSVHRAVLLSYCGAWWFGTVVRNCAVAECLTGVSACSFELTAIQIFVQRSRPSWIAQ